jgi:peroxiredoxin
LHTHYRTLQGTGVEVVSIVVASLSDVEGWCQRAGIAYPMLADDAHQVSEAYGIYNLLGDGLAAPAVFVVATDGRIVWSRVAKSASDPVSVSTIMQHLP